MAKTLDDIHEVLERLASATEKLTNGAESPTKGLKPSRDAWAIAWMLTLPNPTKTAIAKAMGYTHASALAKLAVFNEFFDKFHAYQAVTVGTTKRPGASRRNGYSADIEQQQKRA